MKKRIVLGLIFGIGAIVSAQEHQLKESVYFAEFRTGGRYNAVELEFSRRILDYFSGNVIFVMYNSGVRAGVSFHPVSFLFFQSSLGVTSYQSQAIDGPQFKPDYVYSFAGGARIPLGKLPVAFSVSYRMITMVQNDYNPNGGFVPIDYIRQSNRMEKEISSAVSVGITLSF